MFLKFAKFPKLAKSILNTCQTCIRQNVAICGTRQTWPHSPKAIFEKNVTRLDTFARVIRHSREFGASGHCLVFRLKKMKAHTFCTHTNIHSMFHCLLITYIAKLFLLCIGYSFFFLLLKHIISFMVK